MNATVSRCPAVEALKDSYTPASSSVLSISPERATDAVTICAWWSFRVGGVARSLFPSVAFPGRSRPARRDPPSHWPAGSGPGRRRRFGTGFTVG